MNWIILFIAELFEVAFVFCLGKAKETTGNEMSYGMQDFSSHLAAVCDYQLKPVKLYPTEQLMLYGLV